MAWIRAINSLSPTEKEGIYRILIPPVLYRRFAINPLIFCNMDGKRVVRFYCPSGDSSTLIEVKRDPADRDPIYSIQISDSPDRTRLNWDFVIVNDPDSERFDIDIDERGRETLFGRASRNLAEEESAMKAGLAPGQVRRGLRLLDDIIDCLVHFAKILDIKSIALEALFYHNAISYEKRGFTYFEGYKRMQRINELFQPGGSLQKLMNGSTPFRRPGMEKTVRGRSWAIHDGILSEIEDDILCEQWFSPKMYLMVGRPRKVCTFPGAAY